MIDPKNIKSIGYDFIAGRMEIILVKAEVFDNYSRDLLTMKCSYDTFVKYYKKWQSVKVT
jgi:hypothetical protein